MRGLPLILVALFIDGLQAILSLAFFTMGSAISVAAPVAGAGAGAAVGCAGGAAAGAAGGALAAGVGAIPGAAAGCAVGAAGGALAGSTAGGAVGVASAAVGVALGFAVSICITLTLGAGFVVLLALDGMFFPKYILSGGGAELIPGLDVLPGWTVMAALCVIQANKNEGRLQGGVMGMFGRVFTSGNAAGGGLAPVQSVQKQRRVLAQNTGDTEGQKDAGAQTSRRVSTDLQKVDGIRAGSRTQLARDVPKAANDNFDLQKSYAA